MSEHRFVQHTFVTSRLDYWKSKYNCCYGQKQWGLSYVADSSFRCFKIWISGEKRTKTEASREEQKQKLELKSFCFHLINKTRNSFKNGRTRNLFLRIWNTNQIISNKKTLLKLVFYTYTITNATTSNSTGTSINHFLMIVIAKPCLVFENIYTFCIYLDLL